MITWSSSSIPEDRKPMKNFKLTVNINMNQIISKSIHSHYCSVQRPNTNFRST